jgi:transposase
MEACASAHFWANKLISMGHNVKLMAPQFVKPYVKTNKHDAADAEAICEAVTRPNMRFVPVKTAEQQAVFGTSPESSELHQTANRTSQSNQGLLAEFGIVVPEVSSSYSDDYLSSWKMRITRYPSCFVHS